MKIGVFTGSRANYSSSKTILLALKDEADVNLVNIVGGGATLSRYGSIPELMIRDGVGKPDFTFNMFIDGEFHSDMAKSCGLGIVEMSTILRNCSLDALVVVGDRYDVMSAVIAAAYMNIPLVHTMGGEVSGTIDESIRHAITKFSNFHLVANDDARTRVIKMGEIPGNVFNVGCPRMDLVKAAIMDNDLSSEIFHEKYKGVGGQVDIDDNFILASYHPVTSEADTMREQVDNLLSALNEICLPTILLWPNFDAGSSAVSKSIRTFREKYKPEWLSVYTSFSVEDYSQLMSRTKCLVGNSSSGIREGAFIGTPVVNIGSRQNARIRGKNVFDCSSSSDDIVSAIRSQLEHGSYDVDYIYGDGCTGQRVKNIIKEIDWQNTQKTITY